MPSKLTVFFTAVIFMIIHEFCMAQAIQGQKFSYHAGIYAKKGVIIHENKLFALDIGTGFPKKKKIDRFSNLTDYYPEGTNRVTRYAITEKQNFILYHPQVEIDKVLTHQRYLSFSTDGGLVVITDPAKASDFTFEEVADPDIPAERDSYEGFLVRIRVRGVDDAEKSYLTSSSNKSIIKSKDGKDIAIYPITTGAKTDATLFEFVTDYSGK